MRNCILLFKVRKNSNNFNQELKKPDGCWKFYQIRSNFCAQNRRSSFYFWRQKGYYFLFCWQKRLWFRISSNRLYPISLRTMHLIFLAQTWTCMSHFFLYSRRTWRYKNNFHNRSTQFPKKEAFCLTICMRAFGCRFQKPMLWINKITFLNMRESFESFVERAALFEMWHAH